jgi:N-acetylmuramoyl-L-alanine amidase
MLFQTKRNVHETIGITIMKHVKHHLQILFLFITLFSTYTVWANQATLNALAVSPNNLSDQIKFSFNKCVKMHYFVLSNPSRFVADIINAHCRLPINKINLHSTRIQSIRQGMYHNRLRFVFDLQQKPLKISTMKSKSGQKWTFNLFFDQVNHDPVKPTITDQHKSLVPVKSQFESKTQRNAIVVIDPGHGGKDPGAIGPQGTYEKDIVLAIAKDLYHQLQRYKGITTKLTRSSDHFVPLRERLTLARNNTADLFISVHADAYKNIYAHGASVFALSQHGATSEAARWLAQKENYSELGGVDLEGKSQLLRSVLIDLSQTVTIHESLNLGNSLLLNLHRLTTLHLGQVEQAPFVVLKSPDIPSVLVEVGFISNRNEELKLRNASYRHRIACALADGIVAYLRQYPPQHTVWTSR